MPIPKRRITLKFADGSERVVFADKDGALAVCQAREGDPWQVTHVPSGLLIVQAETERNARQARRALKTLPIEWKRRNFAKNISEDERATLALCVLKLFREKVAIPHSLQVPHDYKLCWQFHGGEVADAVCLLPAGHEGPHQWQPEVSAAVVDLSPGALEVIA